MQILRRNADDPRPSEAGKEKPKPAEPYSMDNIKPWLYYTSACGVPIALIAVLLAVYSGILCGLLKRFVQGVRNKATMVIQG